MLTTRSVSSADGSDAPSSADGPEVGRLGQFSLRMASAKT